MTHLSYILLKIPFNYRCRTFVPNSMLCGEKNETRDHLYFACVYSFTIWMNIAERILGQVISPDWEETVTALMHPNRTRMDTILLRLNFHCAIYAIWMGRNWRRHGGVWISADELTRRIGKLVRNRISSLRYVWPHPLAGLLRRWFELN